MTFQRAFRHATMNSVIFCLLGLSMLPSVPSLAKGPADKVTVGGPGLTQTIEVSDIDTLQALSIGQLEDYGSPIATLPQIPEGYDVDRYAEGPNLSLDNRVRYYPDPQGGRGYVFTIGFVDNPGLAPEYTNKWWRASAVGTQAMQQLFVAHGVQPTNAPSSSHGNSIASIQQIAVWLIPTIAVVLLVGWAMQQHRRRRGKFLVS